MRQGIIASLCVLALWLFVVGVFPAGGQPGVVNPVDITGLETDIGNLEVATNSLNTRMGTAEAGTNDLNARLSTVEADKVDWSALGGVNIFGSDKSHKKYYTNDFEAAADALLSSETLTVGPGMYSAYALGLTGFTNAVIVGSGMGVTYFTGATWQVEVDNATNMFHGFSYDGVFNLTGEDSAFIFKDVHLDGGAGTTNITSSLGSTCDIRAYSCDFDTTVRLQATNSTFSPSADTLYTAVVGAGTNTPLGQTELENTLDGAVLNLGSGTEAATPENPSEVATKQYIDDAASRYLTYYLLGSTLSGFGGITNAMSLNSSASNQVTLTNTSVATDEYIFAFISPTGGVQLTEMQAGIYSLSAYMWKGPGGSCAVKWEGYLTYAGGADYFEVDDTEAHTLTTTPTRYEWQINLGTDYTITNLTDRWLIRAKVTAQTTTPDVFMYTEGASVATLSGSPSGGEESDPVYVADLTDGIETAGDLAGLVSVTLDTDDSEIELSASDCRGKVRVNGDDDAVGYLLPTAVAGQVVTFVNHLYAQVITVDANSGDKIILNDGTALDAGDAADSSGAIDDKGTFIALDDEYWQVVSEQNEWVDGDAD